MDVLNPVSRLLVSAHMTEVAFRERYHYSKQFMVDVTAGTYTRLPDSIHEALKDLAEERALPVSGILAENFGTTNLDEAYELWQGEQRRAMKFKFEDVAPTVWSPKRSPAYFFVQASAGNPTRFSKDLCVPPQTVRRWISGQTKVMPEAIENALRQIEYPFLHDLIERQASWLQEHA